MKKNNVIRNEGLDIRNYAHAVMMILNPDWEAIKKNLFDQAGHQESAEKTKEPERIDPYISRGRGKNWVTDGF
jgi:phage terminase large subunit GpA-like protein